MQPHLVLKPLVEVYATTISSSVASLPSIPNAALRAQVQAEIADIRYQLNATTSVTGGTGGGMLLLSGTEIVIEGWDSINRMRMVRDASDDAVINVIYFGESQP